MPKTKIIIVLGALIALLPILGFPRLWESFFQVVVGLSIILLSIWASIDKRLTLKAKAHKRQLHRRRATDIENAPEKSVEQVIQEESF